MLGEFLSKLSQMANDPKVQQELAMGILKGRQDAEEEAKKEATQRNKNAAQKLSARGLSTAEIADALGVSQSDVESWIR